MHYTLHQLRIFRKVLETGSVTKAAEELFMTQPAVSIQLKQFQDQFDLPLYRIIGKKLHVTEFGREIDHAAERILDQVHQIHYLSLSYKNILAGTIKVSTVSTGKYILPYFLSEFSHKFSEVEVKMDVSNKQEVLRDLSENKAEMALISIPPEDLELEQEILMPNQLYLVGNKDFIKNKKIKAPSDLSDLPILLREEGSATRLMMERFLSKHNVKARKKMEFTSNEAIKQAVLAGLGVSILPLIGIQNELKLKSLSTIPMKGLPMRTDWRLVWLKKTELSPVNKAFVKFIKENKDKIINRYFPYPSL